MLNNIEASMSISVNSVDFQDGRGDNPSGLVDAS
jgi:hypothetical protein